MDAESRQSPRVASQIQIHEDGLIDTQLWNFVQKSKNENKKNMISLIDGLAIKNEEDVVGFKRELLKGLTKLCKETQDLKTNSNVQNRHLICSQIIEITNGAFLNHAQSDS